MIHFIKKNILPITLCLLTLPVFFININPYHDWGDDFAYYINMALHFISGQDFPGQHVINIDSYNSYQLPSGFPLFLTPFLLFFGNSIVVFLMAVSIAMYLLLQVLYIFYKRYFSNILSFLLVLFFCFNYHVLRMKAEIMPVFLLALVLYVCFILFERKGRMSFIMLTILTGFLLSIATVGWALFLVIIIYLLAAFIKDVKNKPQRNASLLKLLMFIFIPVIVRISVNAIVAGELSNDDFKFHLMFFSFDGVIHIISLNAYYYLKMFKLFFEQEIWGWANMIIIYTALVFFIIGIMKKCFKRFDHVDAFFFCYLTVLLLFNCRTSGIRLLIPVFPIMMIYVIYGAKSLISLLPFQKNPFINLYVFLLILSNFINVKNIIAVKPNISYGPQSKVATETFNFIKNNIPSGSLVAFQKPWVLYLYTGCKALRIDPDQGLHEIKKKLNQFEARYVLVCTDSIQRDIYNHKFALEMYSSDNFNAIWKNKGFVLFKEQKK